MYSSRGTFHAASIARHGLIFVTKMAEENNEGSSVDRPMVKGNWTCAECSGSITELRFEPREGSDVYCPECFRNRKPRRSSFDRTPVRGEWSCVDCSTQITELPFQPREGSEVRCRECYAKTKPQRDL